MDRINEKYLEILTETEKLVKSLPVLINEKAKDFTLSTKEMEQEQILYKLIFVAYNKIGIIDSNYSKVSLKRKINDNQLLSYYEMKMEYFKEIIKYYMEILSLYSDKKITR
jgi:hypothetical protein